MNYSTNSDTIILSTSYATGKETTYGFEIIELHSLKELIQLMNTKAVSSGLFMNGHRHGNYLKAVGNIYFIDIDLAPADNETPYYQAVEAKLKELNVSFVSVPSQSADKYPYKRHIAVMVDSFLPTGTKAYKKTSTYILNYICVDTDKIDMGVAIDNVRHLAPASINKNFTNFNDVSNFYQGVSLSLPNEFKAKETPRNNAYDVNTNTLIHFKDNSKLTIYDAKKIIAVGSSKLCFCPKHNDTKASATFYHNSNGNIKIFCGKCGNIKISTNFVPTVPTIAHDKYNYSIVINKPDKHPINNLISKIGKCTQQTDINAIWCFKVETMSDIYMLFLAKAYLVDNGFDVSSTAPIFATKVLLDTDVLQPITVNQTLPTVDFEIKNPNPNNYRYFQMRQYTQKRYLFAEASIYATFQNIINPSRDFITICNLGLAYFEYVIRTQYEQRNNKTQKSKTFPMKLQGEAKAKANKNRTDKSTQTKQANMNTKQKQLQKLLNNPNYLKTNGKSNISAIAKKMKINRKTVYEYLKVINKK